MILKLLSIMLGLFSVQQQPSSSTEPQLLLEYKEDVKIHVDLIRIDLDFIPPMMQNLVQARCRSCISCREVTDNVVVCTSPKFVCIGKKYYDMCFTGHRYS